MKWEYLFVDVESDDNDMLARLDGMGALGWELVSVVPVAPLEAKRTQRWLRHYFKRQR